jgi:hypothetical protein
MSSGWGPGSAAGSAVGASSSSVSSSSPPWEGAVVVVVALGEGGLRFQGHHCRREGGVGSIDPQSKRSRLPAMMESRPEEASLIADRWQPPEAWGACFGTAESKHIQNTSFWRGGRRNQDGPWLQAKCKSNGECNRSTSLSILFFAFVRAVLLSRPPWCDFYCGHFPS